MIPGPLTPARRIRRSDTVQSGADHPPTFIDQLEKLGSAYRADSERYNLS